MFSVGRTEPGNTFAHVQPVRLCLDREVTQLTQRKLERLLQSHRIALCYHYPGRKPPLERAGHFHRGMLPNAHSIEPAFQFRCRVDVRKIFAPGADAEPAARLHEREKVMRSSLERRVPVWNTAQ